jgi:hypothetical protein
MLFNPHLPHCMIFSNYFSWLDCNRPLSLAVSHPYIPQANPRFNRPPQANPRFNRPLSLAVSRLGGHLLNPVHSHLFNPRSSLHRRPLCFLVQDHQPFQAKSHLLLHRFSRALSQLGNVHGESLTFATPSTCLALFVAQTHGTQLLAIIAPVNVKLRDTRWMSAALTGRQ